MSIREYSDAVRTRVVAKVAEALKGAGGAAAEISGGVTFVGDGYFFLQRDGDGIKVLTGGRDFGLKAGYVATVSGAPSLEGGRVVFMAKSARQTGRVVLPESRLATAEDLVRHDPGGEDVNWLRVTVEGRVLGLIENGFEIGRASCRERV